MPSRHLLPWFPSERLRKNAALILTFALSVTIGLLTLLPISPLIDVPGNDKTHHLIAFAALTFPSALLYRRALIWVLPAALIYGIAIELIQPYVGRHGERADFYADAIGVLIGVALGVLLNVILTQPLAKKYSRSGA